MAEIEKVGLSLNDKKCEIVFFSSNHDFSTKVTNEFKLLCPRIKTVQDSEIELLGSALGPISIETIFNQKLKAILLMKERLKHVSSYCVLFLLKNCFLIPKLIYFFRTSEVYRRTDLLLTLENTIISVLENIINIKIDVAAWQQASLPARSGGLGILPPTKLAVVSYLSSFLSVKDLAQQVYAFSQTDVITDALTNFDAFTVDGVPPRSFKQREIYDKITEKQVSQFLQEATASDAARLYGAACKGASDWLNAMPSRSLGLHMSDEQLKIAVSFRLGLPICSSHTCWCGAKVEADGSHAFVCLRSRSRHARHQLGNEIINKALQKAHIPAELEPAGMFRDA